MERELLLAMRNRKNRQQGRPPTNTPDDKNKGNLTWRGGLLLGSLLGVVGAAVLFLIVWMYVPGDWFQTPVKNENKDPQQETRSKQTVSDARWGDLTIVPITIAPPDDFINPQRVLTTVNPWYFKNMSRADVEQFLVESSLSATEASALLDHSTAEPTINGTVVQVTSETLKNLNPIAREKIYLSLMDVPENVQQFNAYRYCGQSLDDWLDTATVSAKAQQMVKKYIYRHGCFMFFADMPVLLPEIAPSEVAGLLKTLYRQSTYLMKLRVSPFSDIESLNEYWGRGGTAKDVRPILESVQQIKNGELVDIVHFLPPFARRRLYTFPRPESGAESKGSDRRDCHWTAYNFFNVDPDDKFTDPAIVAKTLDNDYEKVTGQPILGDLVVFARQNGVIFHSANYVAAGMLYTKNGSKSTWPWMLVKMEDMMNFYPKKDPITVQYFRLKNK